METTVHLFEECKWTLAVWHEINQWTRTKIQINGITRMLEKIKVKHWVQFKKEIMAAICGAVLYHTWRARNWKKFKGRNVHTEELLPKKKYVAETFGTHFQLPHLEPVRDLENAKLLAIYTADNFRRNLSDYSFSEKIYALIQMLHSVFTKFPLH
ncbi:hypothetical protein KY289_016254 [Solanum tuberosum]|nr:hypothetical protein KY289_016254 [Solanum tuberosum]